MTENENTKHLQGIHSIEGKLCDVACASEYEISVEISAKRKVSYIVESEDAPECDTCGDNCGEISLNHVKRQHMSQNEETRGGGISCKVNDINIESSSSTAPSPLVSSQNMPSFMYCEDKNETNFVRSETKQDIYQVCNEAFDISNSKNNSILHLDQIDTLTNIKCSSDFEEDSKKNLPNNCKQVRFSHDVNIIPDISRPPCSSVCHTSVELCCESAIKNESDIDSIGEIYDDDYCSLSDWEEEVHGNSSPSVSQICVCHHSNCTVVHSSRQIFESNTNSCGEKTESFTTINNNVPAIPPCESSVYASAQTRKCSICFITFTDQNVASPGTCSHNFCLDCLQQWAEYMNTCPLDRVRFNMISVKDGVDGNVIDQIPVKNCELEDEDMDNDIDYCEVCRRRSVGREDIMISCNMCGRMYHLTCISSLYNMTLETWVCPDCQDC